MSTHHEGEQGHHPDGGVHIVEPVTSARRKRPDRPSVDSVTLDLPRTEDRASVSADVSPAPSGSVTPRTFKDLFRRHPAGVAVVTLAGPDGAPVGFTATSVISVSADPAVLAFSITEVSSSWPALREASSAVVHFLSHDHAQLSTRFATPGIDRFAGVPLTWLPTGEPRLADVGAWARIRIDERVRAGSSYLVVASVLELADDLAPDGEPSAPRLVYVDRTYHGTGPHSQVG